MGHSLFSDSTADSTGTSFVQKLILTDSPPRLRQATTWTIEGDIKMASFFQSCSNAEMKNETKTVRSRELSARDGMGRENELLKKWRGTARDGERENRGDR